METGSCSRFFRHRAIYNLTSSSDCLASDVDIAGEEQVETLFLDCEPGSVPALGAAYGLNVVVDDSLAQQPDVYFEGGDHANLVLISGTSFQKLMVDARHGRFTGRE